MGFERDNLRPFEALLDGDRLVFGAAFVLGSIEFFLDAGLARAVIRGS